MKEARRNASIPGLEESFWESFDIVTLRSFMDVAVILPFILNGQCTDKVSAVTYTGLGAMRDNVHETRARLFQDS